MLCVCAKSLQLCLTLCNPMVCSPPGSSVRGILQAIKLSGLPFPSPGIFFTQWLNPYLLRLLRCRLLLYCWATQEPPPMRLLLLLSRFSRVRLCATPKTTAHQAPPSLGFSRQEHWSRLPFPSPMYESEKWKWSRSVFNLATPWTAAYRAPLSMGFSRQEYWSGVPLPSPRLLLNLYALL